MTLAQLPDKLFRIISREEHDLELPVKKATIRLVLTRNKEIIFHEWEYKAKEKT